MGRVKSAPLLKNMLPENCKKGFSILYCIVVGAMVFVDIIWGLILRIRKKTDRWTRYWRWTDLLFTVIALVILLLATANLCVTLYWTFRFFRWLF